ncbi:hypothetical protein [Aquimarina sp. AU474]|uniref:hypothetical protein n=1 Tax=Aquimarina sp. AU474 TaxID=2108529 RepID=UPI001356C1E6|nr:hypothetical protein [Aquimarina sp. AU474]
MKTFKIIFIAFVICFTINMRAQEEEEFEILSVQIEQTIALIQEKQERIQILEEYIKTLNSLDDNRVKEIKNKEDEIEKLRFEILNTSLKLNTLKQQQLDSNEIFTPSPDINYLTTKEKRRLDNYKNNIILKNEYLNTTEEANQIFADKTVTFKAIIWNTNFNVPIARFNFAKDDSEKRGDILLFSSVGAGFGISSGRMTETRDENGDLISNEFENSIGLHLGFLFSASTGDDNKNVFAPTISLSLLDFQLGYGYELGTTTINQQRNFITLGYGIPLYKLTRGKFRYLHRGKPTKFSKR